MPEINDWKEVPIDDWVDITDKPLSQKEQRTTGQKIAGAVAPYARPALEYGGAFAGGILAAPANIVAPGVSEALGVAGGYTAGKAAANVLEEYAGIKKPPTPMGALRETGENVKTGLEMGMSGPIIGKTLSSIYRGGEKYINHVIDWGIQRGLRPSVSGKATFGQLDKSMERAREGVKAIISNKSNLTLTDEAGDVVKGELPKNLNQFSEAIGQSKREIFTKYDAMATKTLEKGIPKPIKTKTPVAEKTEILDLAPQTQSTLSGIPLKTGRYGQVVQIPREFPRAPVEPYRGNVELNPLRLQSQQGGMVETQLPYSHGVKFDPTTQKYLIELNPISKELNSIAENKAINDFSPEIVNYAKQRASSLMSREVYTTSEAQDAISHLNNSLNAFYKNPTYENASKASIDSMIANRLRKGLDNVIEQAVGPGYQQLKNTYGALSSLEKDVTHRAIVESRKNIKGLIDFSDIFSGGEVVRGILSMNPATVGKGMAMKSISALYKHWNNPNTIVSSMFGKVEQNLIKHSVISKETGRLLGTTGGYVGLTPQMEE